MSAQLDAEPKYLEAVKATEAEKKLLLNAAFNAWRDTPRSGLATVAASGEFRSQWGIEYRYDFSIYGQLSVYSKTRNLIGDDVWELVARSCPGEPWNPELTTADLVRLNGEAFGWPKT